MAMVTRSLLHNGLTCTRPSPMQQVSTCSSMARGQLQRRVAMQNLTCSATRPEEDGCSTSTPLHPAALRTGAWRHAACRQIHAYRCCTARCRQNLYYCKYHGAGLVLLATVQDSQSSGVRNVPAGARVLKRCVSSMQVFSCLLPASWPPSRRRAQMIQLQLLVMPQRQQRGRQQTRQWRRRRLGAS